MDPRLTVLFEEAVITSWSSRKSADKKHSLGLERYLHDAQVCVDRVVVHGRPLHPGPVDGVKHLKALAHRASEQDPALVRHHDPAAEVDRVGNVGGLKRSSSDSCNSWSGAGHVMLDPQGFHLNTALD